MWATDVADWLLLKGVLSPLIKHEWQSISAEHIPGHLVVCKLVVQFIPPSRP